MRLVVVEDDCTSTVTTSPRKYAGYRTPADGCLQELLGPAYEYAFQRSSKIHDREQNERDSCGDQNQTLPHVGERGRQRLYKPGTETDDDLDYALSPCINRPGVLNDMGQHAAQFFKETECEFQRQEYQDAQKIEKIVYGGGRKRIAELPRSTHVTKTDERVGNRCPDIGTHYHGYRHGNGHSPRYKTDDDGCNGAGRLEQCSRQYAENQADERVRRKCE